MDTENILRIAYKDCKKPENFFQYNVNGVVFYKRGEIPLRQKWLVSFSKILILTNKPYVKTFFDNKVKCFR